MSHATCANRAPSAGRSAAAASHSSQIDAPRRAPAAARCGRDTGEVRTRCGRGGLQRWRAVEMTREWGGPLDGGARRHSKKRPSGPRAPCPAPSCRSS
eukprot:6182625-Pleurochrysis_carterae.AAC.2